MKVSELKAALAGVPNDIEVQFIYDEFVFPVAVKTATFHETSPYWKKVEMWRADPETYRAWKDQPNDELRTIFLIEI